ncbi:hypothetical protein HYQ44_010664 [Verticillium longisporum]|nr:hypothetical protein HYQ44_010664 [Verticillium longisporum]
MFKLIEILRGKRGQGKGEEGRMDEEGGWTRREDGRGGRMDEEGGGRMDEEGGWTRREDERGGGKDEEGRRGQPRLID